MKQLMSAITNSSGRDVRFVIVGPIKHEKLPPPLPDPTKHNEQLAACTAALEKLATEQKAEFINLFQTLDNSWAHAAS